MRSLSGTEGALKAMVSDEETTNKVYRQALESEFPPNARLIVEQNDGDKRQHLAYMREALDSRIWEEAA